MPTDRDITVMRPRSRIIQKWRYTATLTAIIAILYDEGWGVKKNYQMVQEWMLKSANSGWPNAFGWVFDEALERGDLNTAFLMSLKNAFYGETSIEDRGYMMAFVVAYTGSSR